MFKTVLLSGIAVLSLSTLARAETIAALVGDHSIAHIDAATAKVTKTVMVKGLEGRILGIDIRPADGMLYALAADGTIATVDPMTGQASVKSKLETMLMGGAHVSINFNPVADRLRVIGSDGSNLRANVDDGKVTTDKPLTFAEADANKGKKAMVVAGAYTNAMKGAKETALYDLDVDGVFAKQAPPNDGILNTLGTIGVKAKSVAFDIATDAQGANTGWLVADGTLHKIDLANGKPTGAWKITGTMEPIRSIAVLPAM